MPYKNKEDRNANHKKRMLCDPEYKTKHLARTKTWAKNNPEKVRAKNIKSARKHAKKRAENSARWRELNPGKREAFNEHRKVRVLTHYGKERLLLCCWEGCTVCDPDMLSIDHKNNDGSQDRNIRGTGNNLYLSLEKEGYPEGFQTLCHNHQWKKEILRRRALRMEKFRSTLN